MSKLFAYQSSCVRKTSSFFAVAVVAITGYGIAYGQSLATNQITGVDDTTSTPVAGVPHDYITGLNEIVNPANGSLSVRIKAPVPHERGVNWPTYVFTYGSDGTYSLVPTNWEPPDAYGDSNLLQLDLEKAAPPSNGYPVTEQTTIPTGNGTSETDICEVRSGYVFVDPNGGTHPLGVESVTPVSGGTDPCGKNHEGNIIVGGDAQYKASLNPSTGGVTVVDSHGDIVGFEDTNGNERTETSQQNGYTTQTQTGRQETVTVGTNSETMTFPGTVGAYQATWTTATAANGSITIPFTIAYQANGRCEFTSIPLQQGQLGRPPRIFPS